MTLEDPSPTESSLQSEEFLLQLPTAQDFDIMETEIPVSLPHAKIRS